VGDPVTGKGRCWGAMAYMYSQQHPGTAAGIGTNGMDAQYRAWGLEACNAP